MSRTSNAPSEGHGTDPSFTIVVDSREQVPWTFDETPTVRAALRAGDYSIVGAEERIAIERKSLDDFVGSITWGRDRFKRELEKLSAYEFACVIIEGNVEDVHGRKYRSEAHANSVIGSAVAIGFDFVPVIWAGNRAHAADIALRILRRFWAKRMTASGEVAA
jgi:DNA excision repair protein ERCC-4